ncbi:MAG: T9SS type A sorting domain-containing protein [Bacteroidales bacterium]|nr:T9SS type A sorting domain-containing protein [Bacteroidales bacterium]
MIDFYDYWVDVHGVWEAVFPIIKPLDSLGLCEIVEEPEVYLAPNPASGSATLTSDVPVSRLLMHNVDGRLVRDLSPNATRVEIDLAGLPGGLYILSTVTPFGTAHRKLIVR